jgi:hypothetical protein
MAPLVTCPTKQLKEPLNSGLAPLRSSLYPNTTLINVVIHEALFLLAWPTKSLSPMSTRSSTVIRGRIVDKQTNRSDLDVDEKQTKGIFLCNSYEFPPNF